jgi:Ca-activated chloride channel family protein
MQRTGFTMKDSIRSVLALALILIAVTSSLAFSTTPTKPTALAQEKFDGVYIKSHRVTVTIDNQVATTKIEQVFVNETSGPAEGTYLFPLPVGAAVSNLVMYINGVAIQAQLLDAKQAQAIYTETVRRLRDPALLQYVGRSAIQANVFPIPPGEERKLEITYSQIVTADNGLINYSYPLKTDYASPLPVRSVAISVSVASKDAISSVYSPSPLVLISKTDENHFLAGFETSNFRATDDFSLYYGVASSEINANLLTYRNSATEDGYFMLMITPPTKVDANRVIPKDVIVVLDQSGSMQGVKWNQGRAAVNYVLKHLNAQDRFNAIVFSTGYRVFAKTLQPVDQADAAAQWVNGLEAEGGTDINIALTTATSMVDRERQTIVLFLTDGLPTEGETVPVNILANIKKAATPNLRIFSFGVGDDVDTYLLDSLSSAYHGVSVYVRPNENIEEKVSSLYNKITSPVLTAIKLDFGDMLVEDMYPAEPLPDLFAGSQLVIAGRFRGKGTANVTLTGQIDGKTQTYTYNNLTFPENAGGQPFIPRLWATRKIGALLNQIRLNGENPELVETVVRLSVRYGIITPYTSYLIQENDIQNQGGFNRDTPAEPMPIVPQAGGDTGGGAAPSTSGKADGNAPSSGAVAVDEAQNSNNMANTDSVMALPTSTAPQQGQQAAGGERTEVGEEQKDKGTGRVNQPIQQINDRTFILNNGIWTDTLYTSDKMKLVPVIFLSDEYFKLLEDHADIKDYLALGEHVVIVIDDTAYEIKPQ